MKLYLGNLNYSSWSIRAALVARGSGLDIAEVVRPMGEKATRAEMLALSGQTAVPILQDGDLVIHDSLAITEYIAEKAAPGRVWPTDTKARAMARITVAEMHSGFFGLRSQCPVDLRRIIDTPDFTAETLKNIARVKSVWTQYRETFAANGPYLLGQWSAADAFWAPVATRFRTYSIPLEGEALAYQQTLLRHSALNDIEAAAAKETWVLTPSINGPVTKD